MKASFLISYGRPGSLQYGDMPEPVLKENSILIQVKAVSVNPVDWKTRKGILKLIQGSKFPRIIGSDFAGIVKEVAPGINGFKIGDRVYGAIPAFSGRIGALAELARDLGADEAQGDISSIKARRSLCLTAIYALSTVMTGF